MLSSQGKPRLSELLRAPAERNRCWHQHPLPDGLQALVTSSAELCGWGRSSGPARGRAMSQPVGEHPQTLLYARHPRHPQGTEVVFKRQAAIAARLLSHLCRLLEERHCALFKENSSKGLRVIGSCSYRILS